MLGTIRNIDGEKLDTDYHDGRLKDRVIVLGHGVTGNKDRPFLVALAEGLASAGIPALRVSFSGNGRSEGRFQDATISKEVEDLCCVIDACDGREVDYVGHSMGAAVGVLRAGKDTRIRRLVSLAGMVHTDAFVKREFGNVVPGRGFMWDDPKCPLSQAFVDDAAAIRSVVTKGAHIKVPWLLVHGSADDVVPLQDSRDIFERAAEPKKLVPIDGADHVFTRHTPKMVKVVVDWLLEPDPA